MQLTDDLFQLQTKVDQSRAPRATTVSQIPKELRICLLLLLLENSHFFSLVLILHAYKNCLYLFRYAFKLCFHSFVLVLIIGFSSILKKWWKDKNFYFMLALISSELNLSASTQWMTHMWLITKTLSAFFVCSRIFCLSLQ